MRHCRNTAFLLLATALLATSSMAQLPPPPDTTQSPWLDPKRSPDERASLVFAQMTLDEKIQLLHGLSGNARPAAADNGGAGFVKGIARLGLPDLNMADATVGVTRGAARGRYSTLMPSSVAEAAAWDLQLSYDYGALIGRELRAQGYNVSLGGGVNLMREPRGGRNFEYRGEDPILAGKIAAHNVRGIQDQGLIGDIKHFAFNDQETGRYIGNVLIGERAARESDLLAFEIAIKEGAPGMVMCAYNKVGGDWACENEWLLNRVLKQEWGFKGFVLSDWGATHSTAKAMLAGLDHEQPGGVYFNEALKKAVAGGQVPQARIDDSVRRILRTMFASGIVDRPPQPQVVDVFAGFALAQRVAEAGTVLLKNDGVLPLAPRGTVAVIGGHADVGVLTGGGSAQVDPPGGNAVPAAASARDAALADPFARPSVWYPSSPLKALRLGAPGITFVYDDGSDPARAAAVAAKAETVIVFATQRTRENRDQVSLALPGDQNALIAAVTAANPRTAVVLQTGGPVSMPWLDRAAAVVAAWYPGARGGEAIAALLLGTSNFSAKLPMTFPASDADLPHPKIAGVDLPLVPDLSVPPGTGGARRMTVAPFDIPYPEGSRVGYKWFDATGKAPLFPFGHGLSYTRFAYSGLRVTPEEARFTITNIGSRAGVEIAQAYATLPSAARLVTRQLAGWANVLLAPGESKEVTIRFEPLALSMFDVKTKRWAQPGGRTEIRVGGSLHDTPLMAAFTRR